MKFKISYTIEDQEEDSFIVEGETVEECIIKKNKFFEDHRITETILCYAWSEEII